MASDDMMDESTPPGVDLVDFGGSGSPKPNPALISIEYAEYHAKWGLDEDPVKVPPEPATPHLQEYDEWGSPIQDKGKKVGKKRKASTRDSLDFCQAPSLRHKYFKDQSSDSLYNSISSSNETFLELLFEFMAEKQLRTQVAQVSSDWCRLAYRTIRRRVGNKVFSILFAVDSSYSKEFCLSQFFHPSFLCLRVSAFMDSIELKDFRTDEGNEEKQPEGPRLGYLNNLPELEEVQGIISFGNCEMMNDMLMADEGLEIPHVEVFVYVISEGVFFTTPDMQKTGDSFEGIPSNEQGCISSGKCLSSLLFPRSSHFALDVFTLGTSNQEWSLQKTRKTTVFLPSLKMKALIVFKTSYSFALGNWVPSILQKAFKEGSEMVTVMSSTFEFVGTSLSNPKKTKQISALGIGIRGDNETFVITVEFDLSEPNSIESKFYEMSTFLKGNDAHASLSHKGFSYFALAFCYFEVNMDYTNISCIEATKLIRMFHDRFPFVPLQAINSYAEIQVEQATPYFMDTDVMNLDSEMRKLNTRQSTGLERKVVILLVKYPL